MIEVINNYLEKNNKSYFLYKKITDYASRIQIKEKWTINKIIKYEKKWRYINKKYKQINIYGMEFVGIGETIPRIFMYLKNKRNSRKDILELILPTFFPYYSGGIFNEKVFEIFKKDINFITKENIQFWLYAMIVHPVKINIKNFDIYRHREAEVFLIKEEKSKISFSKEIEVYAKEKMKNMGIKKEYICIHARENATKTKNFYKYMDTSINDADVNSFKVACNYMQKLDYQVVRMGKDESKECKIEDVIDYANNYYDALMDFYLIANCKFLIGSSAGFTGIASFWGKPVLITNLTVFCYGFEAFPVTEYNMYLPKKFYSKDKKRFLNLYEMLIMSNRCDRYKENFDREGIELIDNSPGEILKATIEINEKINNTWKKTENETAVMKKYWRIMNFWKKNHKTNITRKRCGAEGYQMVPFPISYSFLKDNLWLMDIEELI